MIFIASDHAGFALKKKLVEFLPSVSWKDLGTENESSVDYPDFADRLTQELKMAGPEALGVLICGSGQGMAIRANRHPHIRAALCWNSEIAELSRKHNNANVLCLPGRFLTVDEAANIFKTFQSTTFEGGRHALRVAKL